MAKSHFVLVHGAHHQPQHWDLLVKVLQQAGHTTSTANLPSVSVTPPPEALNADIAAIKQAIVDAITQGAESIVPILHSYGGIPGFEALATLTADEKAKIARVICISAFIIPKGESLVSVQKADSRNFVKIDVRLIS
jgi:alpha-beta hydrolase superfamily lysophospholipase